MWSFKYSATKFYHRYRKIMFVIFLVGLGLVIAYKTMRYNTVLRKLQLTRAPDTDNHAGIEKFMNPIIWKYRLENPNKLDFSRGQSKIINDLLGGKEHGYYLDIGAGDGETNSVSLYFEKTKGWQGVLVEANEMKHRLAIQKNRQAQMWNFKIRLDDQDSPLSSNEIRLDRLFEMVNHTFIDLLIINLHGFELELIRHINLDKFNFRVITIEFENNVAIGTYLEITKILTSRGFIVAHHIVNAYVNKKDVIYLKS